jgi:hypothetical protein
MYSRTSVLSSASRCFFLFSTHWQERQTGTHHHTVDKKGRRNSQIAAVFTTSGSGDDRSATNSDDDGDGDNTRSSELSNENRSRWLLCRLALPERRKRQTLELKQEGRHKVQQPQKSVLFCS